MPTVLILSLLFIAGGSAWLWRAHELSERGTGAAVLDAAKRDLALGVAETSTNTGPVVDAYLRAVGIEPPANWCAAAVSAWIRRAHERLGWDSPIKGTAQAKQFITFFEKAGLWIPKEELRGEMILPGAVVIWSRGDPKSWTGHIGVVEVARGNTLYTIEGNSGPKGDRVARMERKLDDPRLLGIGRWPS